PANPHHLSSPTRRASDLVRNARNTMVSSCLARHADDDFAPSMSGFQIADRLRGLTESVGAVYDGCHSAGLNEFAQKDTIFLLQRDRKSTRLNSSHEWISY